MQITHGRLQFTIKCALLIIAIASLGLSWVAVQLSRATEEREVAEAIQRAGGAVTYNCEGTPEWILGLFGRERFATVVCVEAKSYEALSLVTKLHRVDVLFVTGAVTDRSLTYIKDIPELGELVALEAAASDAGLSRIASLRHLERVSLPNVTGRASYTDKCFSFFASMSKLRDLELEYSGITGVGIGALSGRVPLRRLNLRGCRITDAGIGQVATITPLETLVISHSKVTDRSIRDLTRLTRLEKLCLDGTAISDDGMEHLSQIPTLKVLSVCDCRVTKAGVGKLKENLPGISVYCGSTEAPPEMWD